MLNRYLNGIDPKPDKPEIRNSNMDEAILVDHLLQVVAIGRPGAATNSVIYI